LQRLVLTPSLGEAPILLALTTDSLFEAIQRTWDRRLAPSAAVS